MTPEEFADNIFAYLQTRNTSWTNEDEIREAVNTTIGIVFHEAFETTQLIVDELIHA